MIYRNGLHDFENDERVDSCSVKFPPTMFANELKNGNFGPSNEISADSDDEDVKMINKDDALQGKPVTLTLESGINVAFGTVVKVGGVGENINGAPLHKNCMGVSIDEALDESTALPVPNSSAYLTVGDVVGSHVAWPIHLIKTQDEKPRTKKVNHQEKRPRLQSPIVESSCLPKSLSMLYRYCKLALKGGEGIELRLDYDVFGAKFVCHVHLEDIIPFCDLKPISYNCIVVYIWHLYRKMKEENKLKRFRFVDPYLVGSHHTQMATRARGLASRLNDTLTNQLVLVPVNVGSS